MIEGQHIYRLDLLMLNLGYAHFQLESTVVVFIQI
jgi:hypothetical protein